jgi:hypothetical protein
LVGQPAAGGATSAEVEKSRPRGICAWPDATKSAIKTATGRTMVAEAVTVGRNPTNLDI